MAPKAEAPLSALGLVGAGAMGAGIWHTLHQRGSSPLVFDADPEVRARLRAQGARTADGLAGLAGEVEVVILSLPSSTQVREVVTGDSGLLASGRGRLKGIIDTTSGHPDSSVEVAACAARHGVAYLDAGVTGSWTGAREGTLTLMVGATPSDYSAFAPVLGKIGGRVLHCGPTGSGHATKALLNMRNIASSTVTSEVLLAARNLGLDLDVLGSLLEAPLPSPNAMAAKVRSARDPGSAQPSNFSLALMAKDCDIAVGLGASAGATMMISSTVQQMIRAAASERGPSTDASELMGVLSGWSQANRAPAVRAGGAPVEAAGLPFPETAVVD